VLELGASTLVGVKMSDSFTNYLRK
jgi:hypothetical protein